MHYISTDGATRPKNMPLAPSHGLTTVYMRTSSCKIINFRDFVKWDFCRKHLTFARDQTAPLLYTQTSRWNLSTRRNTS